MKFKIKDKIKSKCVDSILTIKNHKNYGLIAVNVKNKERCLVSSHWSRVCIESYPAYKFVKSNNNCVLPLNHKGKHKAEISF